MSKKISLILMLSGLVLLLFACGLFIYNKVYDYTAGRRAQELLDDMMAGFEWDLPPIDEMSYASQDAAVSASAGDEGSENELPTVVRPLVIRERHNNAASDSDDEAAGYSGEWVAPSYNVIGVVSIPKLGVRLPVISESSAELLNISCCRLSGTVDVKPVRLVIAGHNLNSHFGGLDTLQLGDEIAFTTVDGDTYYYSATEIAALHKSDGAEVLAVDGWDITLLTCKTDRTMRTMVRFAEIGSNTETAEAPQDAEGQEIVDVTDASAAGEDSDTDEISETAGASDKIETADTTGATENPGVVETDQDIATDETNETNETVEIDENAVTDQISG